MNRRDFLTLGLAGGAAAALPAAGLACAVAPRRPDGSAEPVPIDAMLAQGARTMMVTAHPDDECFWGALLARSSIHYGNPLFMLVFTHGDGGECDLPEGCHPDLASVRGEEMRRAANAYHAELRHERFWNAPLPVEKFPKRHEIFQKWRCQGDPVGIAVESIRAFRPDVIVTFGPDFGMTGHPEHQLASRVATTAARIAGDPAVPGPAPHRVGRVYCALNRYWPFRLAGSWDRDPLTETWDAYQPCRGRQSCLDFMCEATKLHRTQAGDMWNVRYMRQAFGTVWLRQVDLARDARAPDEPVS